MSGSNLTLHSYHVTAMSILTQAQGCIQAVFLKKGVFSLYYCIKAETKGGTPGGTGTRRKQAVPLDTRPLRKDVLRLASVTGGQRLNSHFALKDRNAQTGKRQMPGLEGRAFDPPVTDPSPSTSIAHRQRVRQDTACFRL